MLRYCFQYETKEISWQSFLSTCIWHNRILSRPDFKLPTMNLVIRFHFFVVHFFSIKMCLYIDSSDSYIIKYNEKICKKFKLRSACCNIWKSKSLFIYFLFCSAFQFGRGNVLLKTHNRTWKSNFHRNVKDFQCTMKTVLNNHIFLSNTFYV